MPDDFKKAWGELESNKEAGESPFLRVTQVQGAIADHVAAKLILNLQKRVTALEQQIALRK